MRFAIAAVLAASTALAGCIVVKEGGGVQVTRVSDATTGSASRDLAAVLRDHEAWDRGIDPLTAGGEGDKAALSRLPDGSREAELARAPALDGFIARLERIDPAQLSADEALNRDFLLYQLTRARKRIDFDAGRLAFDAEGGVGQSLAYIAGSTRITNAEEAEAWVQRLGGVEQAHLDMLANARRGLATGMVQPKSVVENNIGLAEIEAAFTPSNDPLLKPLSALPSTIPAAEQAALKARAEAIVADEIMPRRRAWVEFLKHEYLRRAPDSLGLGNRPGGRDLYAFFVQGYTTTDLKPEQIHQIGQDEVARIRARMDEEMRASGWTGDFASFLTFLRTDPRFYSTTREDLLKEASEMAKRADGELPALFGTLPRLTYDVRPVPAEIEAVYTTGRYFGGSFENGVPGGYIVNTSKLDQRPLYELPALTLHEAVPGHHLQIALQQEAEEGPYFRKGADVTAFTEGWGLYSEFLGEEMGFYRTPYERFGRLSYEMWRACRLVADTGIHWMGWDIEQARACFRDNSALAPHNIETELQRYIGWPGQATAYKIGEIRLRDIRSRAETALGDRFDIRRFHDALLVEGPLPLALLDRRMDAWIAEEGRR